MTNTFKTNDIAMVVDAHADMATSSPIIAFSFILFYSYIIIIIIIIFLDDLDKGRGCRLFVYVSDARCWKTFKVDGQYVPSSFWCEDVNCIICPEISQMFLLLQTSELFFS